MKDNIILLDFGNVIAKATTGEWFLTPTFYDLIDVSKIDLNRLKESFKKYNIYLNALMRDYETEYENFKQFYYYSLKEIGYSITDAVASKIAYDFVYADDKFTLYDGIKEELEALQEYYKLVLLTDNWPSVNITLKNNNLQELFDNIYISSYYGQVKQNGLFDYPIKDYNIKDNEVMFVDDTPEILETAIEKKLIPIMMDRENKVKNSRFKKISNLSISNLT